MIDIEDGWDPSGFRAVRSPLPPSLRFGAASRHAAKTRRATSPGFAGGGRSQSNVHRLMVSSCAERGVRRTMGCEPERIGVAFALEAHGLKLCEAFDAGAVLCENLDAFDEVNE